MRTFLSLRALCTFDLDQLQKAFDQQVTFDDTDLVTSALEQSGIVSLAASQGATQFNFGAVTSASMLLVIAFQEVTVQLGSNAAPLVNVRPVPAAAAASLTSAYQKASQPGILLLRGKVGSLYLSNPNATVAQAFVAVVGNAT